MNSNHYGFEMMMDCLKLDEYLDEDRETRYGMKHLRLWSLSQATSLSEPYKSMIRTYSRFLHHEEWSGSPEYHLKLKEMFDTFCEMESDQKAIVSRYFNLLRLFSKLYDSVYECHQETKRLRQMVIEIE